jgi:RNA-splicing ligase RtcB
MDEVARTVVFGIGRTSGQNTDHPLFDSPTWRDVPRIGKLKELAREQLGTVGSGNHYVDLLEDEEGWLWIGVHFGSRGLGHRICTGFLNLAAGRGWDERSPGESMDAPAVVLPLDGTLGQDYFAAMQLAGQYAYAGRDFVVSQVLDILGTTATDEVHNHHNYCIAGTEKIATPNGAKHILDIQAGDVIYAFDLQDGLVETTVTAQWSSGRKPIYTIATANRKIRVSGDHPILTITSTEAAHPERPWMTKRVGAYQWKAAQDLVVGDIVVCAEGYFAQNETVDDGLPRFIGAFLGDGWMRDEEATKIQGYSLGLAIGNATEAHSQRYLELACSLWPQTNWKNNAKGAFGLSCSDRAVYHRLTALGLNHRSHTRRVPSFAFKLSREQKLELLAGYFDADGSVGDSHTSNYGRGTICSVSAALVADLRELAIGCGLQVTNMRREQRLTNYGNSLVYRCVLSASSTAQLDLWHGRKRANSRTARIDRSRLATQQIGYLPLPKGGFAQRIRTITVTDEEEVFDINIEHPGHAFVCEGMVVHNCWKEQHSGENLYVVRKGATPAFPGQRGFIGGSMGDISVIVEGVAGEEAAAGLHSTIHGAGRVMSRTRAAGKRRWARVNGRRVQQQIRPGEVSPAMMHDWLRREGVELRGGGLDESPHVYRRLPDVLARHAATIRILHTLRPLGVAMAGEDVFDPYKD